MQKWKARMLYNMEAYIKRTKTLILGISSTRNAGIGTFTKNNGVDKTGSPTQCSIQSWRSRNYFVEPEP